MPVARDWSDLDIDFAAHPNTGDLSLKKDTDAIGRSFMHLLLTNHYERPFHPEIGSGVRDMLFENMTPITAVVLARKVEDVIENFEPRARLIGVRALPNLDRNEYEVTIEFFVVNTPTELIDMTIFLEVLR